MQLRFNEQVGYAVPEFFTLFRSAKELCAIVKRLASELSPWLEGADGQVVIAIPLMKGAFFFAADLLRCVTPRLEVLPLRVTAYDEASNGMLQDGVKLFEEDIDLSGAKVLLIDDICDSGKTLTAVTQRMHELKVKDICSVVLVKREIASQQFIPNYVGINYVGDEWFVGYGMDSNGLWRSTPDLFVMPNGFKEK